MPDDFEKELETIMNEGAEPATPPATPAPSDVVKAGGREFKTSGDLAKAYDSLVREYSRTKQDLKKSEEWVNFDKYLEENPKLRTALKGQIDEYIGRRRAGQSEATAKEESSIPEEVAGRIEALEDKWEDVRLDREIAQLQTKYKLDEDTVKKVLKESMSSDGISLEKAYKLVMFDQKIAEAHAKGEKTAVDQLQKKRESFVGSSSPQTSAPSGKDVGKLSNSAWLDAMKSDLEQMGFK